MKPFTLRQLSGELKSGRKRMNRARRLYARICREAVLTCPTGGTLEIVARRAFERGLWSNWWPKGIRFSILRILWKIDMAEQGTRITTWRLNKGIYYSDWFMWLHWRGYSVSGKRIETGERVA